MLGISGAAFGFTPPLPFSFLVSRPFDIALLTHFMLATAPIIPPFIRYPSFLELHSTVS